MRPSAQTAGGAQVKRWTRGLIIAKLVEWNDRYGEPPCSADWNPSLARWRAQEWRAERYREGQWPSTNAAKRQFGGSFVAAVRAAGLEPHRAGPRRRLPREARPDVEQRPPRAPRAIEDRLHAAHERAEAAEARVAELQQQLTDTQARAARAEDAAGEARRRARRASDQAARARRSRERVAADADARVRAATDQAQAATREATVARRSVWAAELRATDVRCGEPELLSRGELAALRGDGPSGPAVLAGALKRLARARSGLDPGGLDGALVDLASAAIRWRDRLP
jgi:hypothetical protein